MMLYMTSPDCVLGRNPGLWLLSVSEIIGHMWLPVSAVTPTPSMQKASSEEKKTVLNIMKALIVSLADSDFRCGLYRKSRDL